MHIALNAQLLSDSQSYRAAGVSLYCERLLAALGMLARDDRRFSAFVNARALDLPGVDLHRTRLPLHRPLARIAWEQTRLPLLLRNGGGGVDADLLHGLVNVLPLLDRTPGVVTVHDLSFLHMNVQRAAKRLYLSWLCRASARRARAVIAVSQQTADDVVRSFGVPGERVHVVHNGVDARFTTAPHCDAAAEATRTFREQHGLPERFFLYVGTLEPRKNLTSLVRAYGAWRRASGSNGAPVKLVLAGSRGWFYDAIFREVERQELGDAVLFPGYLPHDELPDWYRTALAFVFPSRFEGFGLPVLEAMACGTPVACSRLPSLLEVAGDAALTFAINDEVDGPREGALTPSEQAMVDALDRLSRDAALRDDLRARGLAQAARFSWQATAHQTLAVYESVLGQISHRQTR